MRKTLSSLKSDERGNAILIMYIGMFMTLMAVFGFAVDMSNVNSARSASQATLDSATVAGVSQLVKNKNRVDSRTASAVAKEFYGMNRIATPGQRCLTGTDLAKARTHIPGSKLITNSKGCGWIMSSSKASSNTYTMSSYECVSTIFMTAVKDEFCFFTSATARTSQLAN